MKPSFLRLAIRSVLAVWVAGLVATVIYARSRTWTVERARKDGVFLMRDLLATHPPKQRGERLAELQDHFDTPFSLVSLDEVERKAGRTLEPREMVLRVSSEPMDSYFLLFEDGAQALSAGPIHPAVPAGVFPIGMVLALLGPPFIAGLIALRVEYGLAKVEAASRALGVGELDARVPESNAPGQELAASFNEMAERVERLVRDREEWVQAVSHELGAPLSRLRFHLELMSGKERPERDDRLRSVKQELDRLDDLVAELLGYMQSQDVELEARHFDPKSVLLDLGELARLEVSDEREIEVEVLVQAEGAVYADPRMFQRAVENLLRNAARFANHKVRVDVAYADNQGQISVHDDGPGIPEAMREKVKTPFYRLPSDQDRRTGGAGLGLAIVARIVERHGGTLEVSTSPLGGALVCTSWPER